MSINGQPNVAEMDTFLPQDGSKQDGQYGKYKVSVSPTKKLDADAEALQDGKSYFDPFKGRHSLPNSTTDCDTLTHLLKASLGSGILAMPIAFRDCGIVAGIFATILVSLVCTHCAYILVKCAHELYYRTRVTSMSFADVGEIAFANGPPWARRFSGLARVSIIGGLFAAYFGTCSVYTVIIATNFQQVIEFYTGDDETTSGERIRLYIAALMIPLVLISWVPNLKKLAPISMVANAFMGVGLLITFYYLSIDLPSVAERAYVAPFEVMPQFFSITIFAMEAIGVVMPLENAMKTPQHFIGICGVLNQGMGGVTMIYIFLGFLGYLKYGAETKGSITLNLPTEDYAAQAVKILVGLAVFCTYGLQYFVCLEIVWNSVKDRFQKNSALAEYVVRTLLTVAAVLLAVAVPTIGPFLGLIGALCFSLLGLIIPVFIEFVTYWDKGFGPCNWIVWKNILVLICGFLALVFGSYTSFLEIINVKDPLPPLETFRNESAFLGNETMAAFNTTLQQFGDVLNSTIEAINEFS